MKFVVSRLTLCALTVVLAACSSIGLESKKIDYKSASTVKVPTLEVPPDLTSPGRDDRFAVPDTGGKGTATFSAYTGERSPQARAQQQSGVLPQVDKARIEPIFTEFDAIVTKHEPKQKVHVLVGADFYNRVKGAYALIATTEARLYGNIVLKKGVIFPA